MHTPPKEGIENSRSRIAYRFASPGPDDLVTVFRAYTATTGKIVYPKMKPLLALAWRVHGPDTPRVLAELYARHGIQNLLLRLTRSEPDVTSGPKPSELRPGERPDLLAGLEPPDPSRPAFNPTSTDRYHKKGSPDVVPCSSYSEHGNFHVWRDTGFVCLKCESCSSAARPRAREGAGPVGLDNGQLGD